MIATFARFIKGSLRSRIPGRRTPKLQDLQAIRHALLQCVADCETLPAIRLRHKIAKATSVQELWLLRNDAYQLVSQRHSQTIAAERINGVLPCFECCMDARQLVRIK